MSDCNVAQADYALSRLVHFAGMHSSAREQSCDGVDDREDFKYRRLSGQPQYFGGLSWFLRPLGCAFSLLQAGDILGRILNALLSCKRHAPSTAARVTDTIKEQL